MPYKASDKRDACKASNAIKESADNTILQVVGRGPTLAFLNPTRIEGPDGSGASDALPHVKTYAHEKELGQFLKGKSHVLKECIDKEST